MEASARSAACGADMRSVPSSQRRRQPLAGTIVPSFLNIPAQQAPYQPSDANGHANLPLAVIDGGEVLAALPRF